MRNATINLDFYQLPAEKTPLVEFPSFLLDIAEDAESFIETKKELGEVFNTYFQSEQFKERNDTGFSLMLLNYLNMMLDNIYLAQLECLKIKQSEEIRIGLGMTEEEMAGRIEELRKKK